MDDAIQSDLEKLKSLTSHQRKVLAVIYQAGSREKAAKQLFCGISNIDKHLKNIRIKLGIDEMEDVPRHRETDRFASLLPLLNEYPHTVSHGKTSAKRRRKPSVDPQLVVDDETRSSVVHDPVEPSVAVGDNAVPISINSVTDTTSTTLAAISDMKPFISSESVVSETVIDRASERVAASRSGNVDHNAGLRRFVLRIAFVAVCIFLVLLGFQRFRPNAFAFLSNQPVEVIPGQTCIVLVDPPPGPDARVSLEAPSVQQTALGVQIRAGDVITAMFTISNTCSQTVKLGQLRAGGRLHRSCANTKDVKWDGDGVAVEFEKVSNIILEPGQRYTYRQSRAFFEPGIYFVEPLKQGGEGPWGGFSPSMCSDLEVMP